MKAVLVLMMGLATAGIANAADNSAFDYYRGEPGGSYVQSCTGCGMNGSVLYCQCNDGHGHWRNTSIDMNGCASPAVANTFGHLTCN